MPEVETLVRMTPTQLAFLRAHFPDDTHVIEVVYAYREQVWRDFCRLARRISTLDKGDLRCPPPVKPYPTAPLAEPN